MHTRPTMAPMTAPAIAPGLRPLSVSGFLTTMAIEHGQVTSLAMAEMDAIGGHAEISAAVSGPAVYRATASAWLTVVMPAGVDQWMGYVGYAS